MTAACHDEPLRPRFQRAHRPRACRPHLECVSKMRDVQFRVDWAAYQGDFPQACWVRAPGKQSSGVLSVVRAPGKQSSGLFSARTGRQTPVERVGRPRRQVKGNQRRNAGTAVNPKGLPVGACADCVVSIRRIGTMHLRRRKCIFPNLETDSNSLEIHRADSPWRQ